MQFSFVLSYLALIATGLAAPVPQSDEYPLTTTLGGDPWTNQPADPESSLVAKRQVGTGATSLASVVISSSAPGPSSTAIAVGAAANGAIPSGHIQKVAGGRSTVDSAATTGGGTGGPRGPGPLAFVGKAAGASGGGVPSGAPFGAAPPISGPPVNASFAGSSDTGSPTDPPFEIAASSDLPSTDSAFTSAPTSLPTGSAVVTSV
ncbi:uncharacterized protein I206_106690 [Kwoniella pini CBS 10737]|uniref:Uncharacterized protein n=1 Tax=Kwoniella pini CBS 10737 TaxID=1296096 RepID=A0A1B9HTH6_9TREE|nr:uncharacterized protein I206_07421 [Kwoniella pini CBS 10737]OCF46568.1 hypothetical protein I206_07421 [Kwoniella pini CBS 10737]